VGCGIGRRVPFPLGEERLELERVTSRAVLYRSANRPPRVDLPPYRGDDRRVSALPVYTVG
jgi:hypothetical protein